MIWVDTDGGVDDALAISLLCRLLRHDEIAISTVFGNVSAKQAAHNVSVLLEKLGTDVSIAVGSEASIDSFARNATSIHGNDGMGNVVGSPKHMQSFVKLADRLKDIQRSCNRRAPLTILGIGPATNIPSLISAYGARYVTTIVMMCGTIFDRGNITPDAEFNLYNDPLSFAETLESGPPVTIVPLDLCRKIIFQRSALHALSAFGSASELLVRAHDFYMTSYKNTDYIDGCFPHDTIALLVALYPSKFMSWTLRFNLEFSGSKRGAMRFSDNGKYTARFCLGGDLSWVRALLNTWQISGLPEIELKHASVV